MSTICLFHRSPSCFFETGLVIVPGAHQFGEMTRSEMYRECTCLHLATARIIIAAILPPCIFMWVSWIWTQVLRLMQEALCSLIIWDISHQSTKEDRWGEQTNIKEGGTQHHTCTSPFDPDFLLMDTETWTEVLGRQSLSSLCLKRLCKVLWVGISREQFSRVPEAWVLRGSFTDQQVLSSITSLLVKTWVRCFPLQCHQHGPKDSSRYGFEQTQTGSARQRDQEETLDFCPLMLKMEVSMVQREWRKFCPPWLPKQLCFWVNL